MHRVVGFSILNPCSPVIGMKARNFKTEFQPKSCAKNHNVNQWVLLERKMKWEKTPAIHFHISLERWEWELTAGYGKSCVTDLPVLNAEYFQGIISKFELLCLFLWNERLTAFVNVVSVWNINRCLSACPPASLNVSVISCTKIWPVDLFFFYKKVIPVRGKNNGILTLFRTVVWIYGDREEVSWSVAHLKHDAQICARSFATSPLPTSFSIFHPLLTWTN